MKLLFEPPTPTLAKTSDGSAFPVRRVFCVGRNYAAHAREMGKDPDREPPFFFTKWTDAVVPSGATIGYPSDTKNLHYEAELVVAIDKGGRDIPIESALDHVYGYATGLDMTRRDIQNAAKDMGRPWDAGKNFDEAAPLGLIHPASEVGHLDTGPIQLTVNGEVKQKGDLNELIWSVPEIIAFASHLWGLKPGDLIYTGTPAGVGPVVPGDVMVVSIQGLTDCVTTMGKPW